MKVPAICVDELRDMLSAVDGCLTAVIEDDGLSIVDDEDNDFGFITFYERDA